MDQQARILFVDDEEGIVNTLRAVFRLGYEVHTTTSPAAALDIVRSQHIHVVVSDQRMPEMLGVDLLGKVRELSPATMRILLTGYSDLTAIIGSVNSGEVFRFINKPWNHQELKATIAEAAAIAVKTAHGPATIQRPATLETVAGARHPGQVLVLDDDPNVGAGIGKLLGNQYGVHQASSIQHALQILERTDIAVIISDMRVANEDAVPLLRILKQQYPLILTIMLTDLSDADTVVKLINQVQIFRFANKPIRQGALQLSIKAAMKQHDLYRLQPELLARQKVEQPLAAEPESVSLAHSIANSLRALRNRFGFLGAGG